MRNKLKVFPSFVFRCAKLCAVAFVLVLFGSFAAQPQIVEAAPKANKLTGKKAWAICRKRHGNRLARVRIVNNKARCITKKRTAKKKKQRRRKASGGITYEQASRWCKHQYKWAGTVQAIQRNGRWYCRYWH